MKNGIELLYHHAEFYAAGTSPRRGAIFYFLPVTLLNDRDCANNFAIKTLKYGKEETLLILLDRGRFVVVYPHSTLFLRR